MKPPNHQQVEQVDGDNKTTIVDGDLNHYDNAPQPWLYFVLGFAAAIGLLLAVIIAIACFIYIIGHPI